jgi:hypothetical protein
MSCELFEGVFGKKIKSFTRKIREKEKKKLSSAHSYSAILQVVKK